jgi:hypothetical protein
LAIRSAGFRHCGPFCLGVRHRWSTVRYALNQWDALTRVLEDGDLEIDKV